MVKQTEQNSNTIQIEFTAKTSVNNGESDGIDWTNGLEWPDHIKVEKNELAIITVNNGEADGTSQTNGEINET